MPRNPAGVYTLPESAFESNTPISSAAVNSDFSDIAAAITGSLSRAGLGGMTAQLQLALSGFAYSSDPDTGMSRSAANTQVISCGGQDWTFSATDVTSPAGASLLPLIGEIKMWAFATAPSGYVLMQGQACTLASYPLWRAALVSAGSPYGSVGADPAFPDLRCMVPAGQDPGSARGLLVGANTLGNPLGEQRVTLTADQLPVITPAGTVSQITPAGTVTTTINTNGTLTRIEGGGQFGGGAAGSAASVSATSTFSGTPVTPSFTGTSFGGGNAHTNVQPTIIINFIGRAA